MLACARMVLIHPLWPGTKQTDWNTALARAGDSTDLFAFSTKLQGMVYLCEQVLTAPDAQEHGIVIYTHWHNMALIIQTVSMRWRRQGAMHMLTYATKFLVSHGMPPAQLVSKEDLEQEPVVLGGDSRYSIAIVTGLGLSGSTLVNADTFILLVRPMLDSSPQLFF